MFTLHQPFLLVLFVCLYTGALANMSLKAKSAQVSHLTDTVTKEELRQGFTEFGTVEGVVWKLDAEGEQTGIAFVVFQEEGHVQAAVQAKTKGSWQIAAVDIPEQELKNLKEDQDTEEKMMTMLKTFTEAGKRSRAWKEIFNQDLLPAQVKKETFSPNGKSPSSGTTSSPGTLGHQDSSYKLKVPKLPIFSGDKKKDSSFARWQFHVKVFLKGPYEEYSILNAISQSVRSPAADTMINMGDGVTVSEVLAKFRTRYGSVLQVEALTEKLYSLKQGPEDVATWAFNIEEVVYEIEEKDGIKHEEAEEKVKGRFWYGLKESRIRDATRATWRTMSFDDLLVMGRTLEEEYAPSAPTAKVQQQTSLETKMDQLVKTVEDMSTRLQKLETAQTSKKDNSAPVQKSDDSPKEKKPAKCTKCKLEGHLYFGCKKNNPEIKCRRCGQEGHLQHCCRVPLNSQ